MKYKFFLNGALSNAYNIVFCASLSDRGCFFKSNGKAHFSTPFQSHIGYNDLKRDKSYKEISFEQAIKSIRTLAGQKNVYKILGIPKNPIKITPEIKQKSVDYLKSIKAFNEDSAAEIEGKDYLTYSQLAEDKVIQEYDNRFFVGE